MRSKDLVPLLSAVILGTVSGYYIFSPGLKQIAQEQRSIAAQQQSNKD